MDSPTPDMVIKWCQSPSSCALTDNIYGSKVIRVSVFAIKWGESVHKEEAINQEGAYHLLDPTVIRVPRVYLFFQEGSVGYLVMEYIEGYIPSSPKDLADVAQRVHYLHSFTSTDIGLIRRRPDGEPGVPEYGIRTLLWPERVLLRAREDLENFVRTKLIRNNPSSFRLSTTTFRLCHMDLAPRNLLYTAEGDLAILDWAYSGFWPRAFEIASLRKSTTNELGYRDAGRILEASIRYLSPFTEEEEGQLNCVLELSFNLERYSFDQPATHTRRRRRILKPEGETTEIP